MSKHKPLAGTDLGKAVCKHFGLNPNHVDVVSQIDFRPQAMASIKLTIMLTAEDLAGIALAAGAEGFVAASVKWATNKGAQPGDRDDYSGPWIPSSLPAKAVPLSDTDSDTLRRYWFDAFREPLVKGESLVEHDPRLDEIISLLSRIVEAAERKDFLGRERAMPVSASETLRRYGASPKADHEAETLKTLKDQQEELAKIRTLLYEIAKNTMRSACLAEDSVATSAANVQTVLRD